MDPGTLSKLLDESTSRLTSLYSQLGHPPDLLASALSHLHTTIKDALDGEVAKVQTQVDDAQRGIDDAQRLIAVYKAAMGDDVATTLMAGQKRKSGSSGKPKDEQSLLPRLQTLQSESNRLRSLYTSRKSQVGKLRQQLDGYRPLLGDDVVEASTPTLPEPTATTTADAKDADGNSITPLPTSYLQALSNALSSCSTELKRRTDELQTHLVEIVQLWSELAYPPDLGGASSSPAEETFDSRILKHLKLRPVGLSGEGGAEWEGVFEAAPSEGGSESETDSDNHMLQQQHDTPTRSSGPHTTLTLPSYAPPTLSPSTLVPSPATISLAASKREHLEAEKRRREERIQELYDDLVELWVKFDVQQDEMDAFVAANAGSTRGVVEAYECELLKMLELKSQHMALFISNVRARIASVWDVMQFSFEERQESFPAFFWDLSMPSVSASGSSSAGAVQQLEDGTTTAEATDALLAQHEAYEARARDECDKRLPIIKMVAKYRELEDEETALEESAKDTTRLLKGARGDPGRLLREEKMRKRVRALKPKLEEEMCRAIPEWEEEYGKAFTVDGVRYMDVLRERMPAAAGKKRGRTISGASSASASVASTPLLGSSTAHNRQASVASTPMRPHTPGAGLSTGTATKKARLGAGAAPPSSVGGKSAYGRTPMSASTAGTTKSRPPVAGYGNASAGGRGLSTPGQGGKTSGSSRIPSTGARSVSRLGRNAAASSSPSKAPVSRGAAQTLMKPPVARTAFRPRPSALEPVGHVVGLGISSSAPGGSGSHASSRNGSGHSVLSDATVVVHAHASAVVGATRSAMAPPVSSTNASSRYQRRGPSLSLSGHLATLSATGTAFTRPSVSGAGCTIRSVSSEDIAGFTRGRDSAGASGKGGGPNWAVLEDEEEEGEYEREVGIAAPPQGWNAAGEILS